MTAMLEEIRNRAARAAYPCHLLQGCETALILFAAGFLGKQDAVWIAEAGLRATCVDTDGEKLRAMMEVYPADWAFRQADVYAWADPEKTPVRYDVVSLDPWTQDFQCCADNLPAWCSLARRAVILGTGVDTTAVAPDGWEIADVRRRSSYDGGVFWTCLEPA